MNTASTRKQRSSTSILVGTELGEQRPHVVHPPVVQPPHAVGHRLITAGPVADGQLDLEHRRTRGGDGEEPPELGPSITTALLDDLDHLVGDDALPCIEHLVQEGPAIFEVPVEAALGHAKGLGQRFDADGIGPAHPQCPQSFLNPAGARSASRSSHLSSRFAGGPDRVDGRPSIR